MLARYTAAAAAAAACLSGIVLAQETHIKNVLKGNIAAKKRMKLASYGKLLEALDKTASYTS